MTSEQTLSGLGMRSSGGLVQQAFVNKTRAIARFEEFRGNYFFAGEADFLASSSSFFF